MKVFVTLLLIATVASMYNLIGLYFKDHIKRDVNDFFKGNVKNTKLYFYFCDKENLLIKLIAYVWPCYLFFNAGRRMGEIVFDTLILKDKEDEISSWLNYNDQSQ